VALKEYQRKRHFDVTPEPSGKKTAFSVPGLLYVFHKHRASQLHYDLRLEWRGVLRSWAVPKGPSLDPSVKRLATQTEDHPLDYGKFEGIIPEMEYGGGTVLIWDQGIWMPESEDVDAAFRKGNIKFTLKGKKLKGSWVLVRTRRRDTAHRSNWLLIKHRDRYAQEEDILQKEPRSIISKRLLVEIARDEGGNLEKAATGDPPSILQTLIKNPKLISPRRRGKKTMWHSNRQTS
jgi:bifunctional non-homologous end joining protein LigD